MLRLYGNQLIGCLEIYESAVLHIHSSAVWRQMRRWFRVWPKKPAPPTPARARPPVRVHEYCLARAFSWRSFSRRKSPTDFDFRPFPAKKASRRRAAPPDRDNGVETAPLDAVTLPGLTPFKTARQLALPAALWRVTSRPQGAQGGRKGTWRPIHMTQIPS